jgi:CheY-like chemotaxis protein/HPt (histidine-containing phosphotransfer) domain-containing protein
MPEPLGSIPIIGITAGASEAELEDCLNAGMSAVLTKPLNVGDLYEALREVAGGEPLPAPAAAPPADAPKPASPARLPVLLVDDTPINLAVAGKQLDRLGLAHEAATGGAEALAMLERADYAMALVDISMPDIDGLEFTLRRREHEAAGGRRMPIVAMTGHASAEDRRRFLAAGMDGVLAKPIRREELAAVVEAWIPAADAVPTEATAPAAAVPIDLAGLGRILDSTDRAELLEVAAMFAEQAPGYAVAIHEAVAAGDRKALAMAAHRARGAAANVAAETLRGIVAALEDEAEAADWGRLRQLDGTIDAEVERILEFIRAG